MTKRSYRALITFMGVCTPGGALFLFALLTSTGFHFHPAVWFLLAAAGGVGGYAIAKRV